MHRFSIICVIVYATSVLSGSVRAQAPQQAAAAGRAAARAAITRGNAPAVLPGTSESAFTTIQGNVLNSTSGALPNAVVRLRDARLGGIVDTQLTDRSGLFAFRAVDPGIYVVELTANEIVLAASQVLSVNAGEVISAIVRLPFRIPPFAGLFGQSAAQAATVTSAAVTSGVLASDDTVGPVSAE